MFKKPVVRWLSLLLIVIAVIGIMVVSAEEPAPKAAGLVLEDMPIVLPANATEVEKTAAKELQHYLREITGSGSSVVTEGVSLESAIYLGATKFAEANNVTYTDDNGMGEGWAIKAVGQNLVITGGAQRGTLYGVYHLLEDVLGVHWWNMWEEYVPEMEDAVLPYDFELKGEPVFAERGLYANENLNTLYYARNRMNGWANNAPQAYGGEEAFSRPYHVHTFNMFFPPFYTPPANATAAVWRDAINPEGISYFKEHPEWYSWSNARQERISYGQMCFSAEGLVEAFVEKALIAIELSYKEADEKGIDRPKYISITPNDTGGHCECASCQAELAARGPSGRLLRFINEIAAGIGEVYPEIKVETLAYAAYFEVPLDDTVPADNMVLRLASSDVNIIRGMEHPTNAKVKNRLIEWAKILKPGQLWYWDYAITYVESGGICPNYFEFGYDYRLLHENGGWGVFIEVEKPNETEMWDMKHWVLTKLIEDPYQDEHELVKTFLNGYYGEAAAEDLYSYLTLQDALADACQEHFIFDQKLILAPWMTGEDAKKCNDYFTAAIEKTENNDELTAEEKELFINRICVARISLDRVILANFKRYNEELAAHNDPNMLLGLGQAEVGSRMLKALNWLMSMELEEDYTGAYDPGKRSSLGGTNLLNIYSEYSSGTDEITGEYMDHPPLPQQIYDDHPGVSEKHIYDFTASAFWDASQQFGYFWVKRTDDSSYEGGSSVMVDHAIYMAENTMGNSHITFSESKAVNATFRPKWYLGNPVQNDGQWHLYRAEDVVVLPEGADMLQFWSGYLRFDITDMDHLLNDKVDVYVSMKVTGDPSATDPNNYAKVYIDRIIVVEDCTSHDINYTSSIPATCESNEILVGMCPICGKEAREEVVGTKLPHSFVDGYTYHADTNTYTAQCSVCGLVEYSNFKTELPQEVLDSLIAEGTEMDRVYDFGLNEFTTYDGYDYYDDYTANVEDSDSRLGQAVMWDLNKMGTGVSPRNYFVISETNGIYVWRSVNGIPVSEVPKASDIITDGQYHVYKMEGVNLFAGDSTKLFLFDQTFAIELRDLLHLKGQLVDLYLSFKVVGDLNYDTVGQMPKYYIDRVIIVENCTEHYAADYTYDAATGTYVGTCGKCHTEIVYDFGGELPAEVLDSVNATGSTLAHVYDFTAAGGHISTNGGSTIVDDADSPLGKAFMHTAASQGLTFTAYNANTKEKVEVGFLTSAELQANWNTGYQLYGFKNFTVPETPELITHFYSFPGWNFLCNGLVAQWKDLTGHTVDIYISMKIVKTGANPVYYIDRVFVVDNCADCVSESDREFVSAATCYKGDTYRGACGLCGKVTETELVETRKPHDFGPYTADASGKMVASCRNDGCTVTKTSDDSMPQAILDKLAAAGLGVEHAHVYSAADGAFSAANGASIVDDADSPTGKAFKHTAGGVDLTFTAQSGSSKTVFKIPAADMQANWNKGYQLYSFEDFAIPATPANITYFYAFPGWNFQSPALIKAWSNFAGKTVDFHISMKVVKTGANPVYYIDRIIVVDSCEDYEIEYKDDGTADCFNAGNLIGVCPVCDKVMTKPGAGAAHSFTNYIRLGKREEEKYTYIAECDNGCGATDTKYDPRLTLEEKLPAELPQSARNHVIASYSIDEFILSGIDDSARWCPQLDRPVGVREYDTELTSSAQYGLNTSSGISAAVYKAGMPSNSFGSFSGAEIMANAGDGQYHLYEIKNVVPIVYDTYEYLYVFSDWVMQCWMFDDDLISKGYKGKALDIYLYMKVDGDPTCAGEEKPTYYIDQLIVASSCQTDENWIVTKEPTCTQPGEMVGDCAVCGLKGSTVAIPVANHTYKTAYKYKDATCKSNMFEWGICTVCGGLKSQEVPGTMLEHSFTNYVLQEDGVTEIAYCDNGCGERHIRSANYKGENAETPDILKPILPVLGGAAGGSSFGFSDIKASDWYFESVKNAWENKLVNGVTATEFRPNDTLTVAQAVKLASAYHERYNTGDVTLENGAGNWYSSYVDYAVENGIVDRGYASKSTADMNKAIDRSEFVAIFANAMDAEELVGYNTVSDNAIPDVKMDDANADAIYSFYRAGILTGSDGKGTFNPESSIKRSEVAAILSRMFDSNVRQSITLN